jgi:CheY-like chemotaxis protein
MHVNHRLRVSLTQRRPPCIFVVDDDPDFRDVLAQTLEEQGYLCALQARTAQAALRMAQAIIPQFLVITYALPDMDGIALYDALLAQVLGTPVPALLLGTTLPEEPIKQRHLESMALPLHLDLFLHVVQKGLSQSVSLSWQYLSPLS